MAKNPVIDYLTVSDLFLDPANTRLGRSIAGLNLPQKDILDVMRDWSLGELAESFLTSGFWPQEPLIAVKEELYGEQRYVVVDGNRRLAALKYIKATVDGNSPSKYWTNFVKAHKPLEGLFDSVPYIEVANRSDMSAYLGFRHVTGSKEWRTAEKAQYIAKLIEEDRLSYEDVRRKIGGKTPIVRHYYIAHRLLLQMQDQEGVAMGNVENKFSALFLSLRTQGVQSYLHIDVKAPPDKAMMPVPTAQLHKLVHYSKWLFGDENSPPLFTDPQNIDNFGKILESQDAVDYLERTDSPRFELAIRKAGVGEQDVIALVSAASDNIRLALTDAHMFRKSTQLQKSVRRLGEDFFALLNSFPSEKAEIIKEIQDAGTA